MPIFFPPAPHPAPQAVYLYPFHAYLSGIEPLLPHWPGAVGQSLEKLLLMAHFFHVSSIPSLLFNRLSSTRLNTRPCDGSAEAWNESSISEGNCTRNLLSHAYPKYGRLKIAKRFCNSGLHSPEICLWQREVLGAFISCAINSVVIW